MTPSPPSAARDAQVVFLVNFLSPNLREVFREVERRVGRLTVLASVPIESNRHWAPDDAGLDVRVQRTWTLRRGARHPGGYDEQLFVHVPLDTWSQLRRLRPDAIVSLELGARSALAGVYRRWSRRCAHVVSVYGSERSEAGRGRVRNALRRRILKRADIVTYNGPSCRRLLLSLGADPERMTPWNYAADPDKIYRGPLADDARPDRLRLLTVGQFIDRKGVLPAVTALAAWAERQPRLEIDWTLVGSGPLEEAVRSAPAPANLRRDFRGHADPEGLRTLYRDHDALLFPTLGDEWGLVVDEALGSGLPVLGSIHSQAVETLIVPGQNGWSLDPESPASVAAALDALQQVPLAERHSLRERCRASVTSRTPVDSAEQFVAAVDLALRQR